ncbi:MAG: neutral zinc metallopeptidase [Chloroflexota bacterium]|nr:neutral zinc metallopeptidase [Chloroflexota bacterium]
MPRLPAVILVLLLALSGVAIAPQVAYAQDEQRDAREARFTPEEIFRLAADRKFNAMYDRIHPDAHAVIPRAAAVGTFEQIYAEAQAGRATVTGVAIGQWTWGVTGQTYPSAAQVKFQQPYVENGQQRILEDEMYLVRAGQAGEFRWFFGSSREQVDAAIATFGQRTTPIAEGNILQDVTKDLDAFYRESFGYTEFRYESPGRVLIREGEQVGTACGATESGFWAFYCPPDKTVYLDAPFLGQLQQQADFAVAFVIAHEWAHHVQTGVGIERVQDTPEKWNELYSIDLELMADCLTGAWTLDSDTRSLLETDDVDEVLNFTVQYLGDPPGTDEYDPQAHGTADQRVQSFLNGYENGFLGCNQTI